MARPKKTTFSIAEMLQVLRRSQSELARLERRRKKLAASLAKTDRAIALLEGTPAAPARRGRPARPGRPPATRKKRAVRAGRRPRNKMTLVQGLLKVLSKDKPQSVPEIVASLGKIGYKSSSKTFRTIIYQTLSRNKQLFRKASRGRYVLREESPAKKASAKA
jgi:hypothetical protein